MTTPFAAVALLASGLAAGRSPTHDERRSRPANDERVAVRALVAPADAKALGLLERPATTQREDLGEAGIRYQIGAGKPEGTLIFLHGWGGAPGGELFDGLAEGIAESGGHFTAVAPWLRSPGEPHTMSDQLVRARAVIAAQPGPVVLVGHSFGGKAALALAKEFPGKVVGVVGLAPSVNMAYAYWKAMTGERGLPDSATAKAAYATRAESVRRELSHTSTDTEEGQDRADRLHHELSDLHFQFDLAGYDESKLESQLATSTLVFHGTDDGAVSIHYARRFAERNPNTVELVELVGEGHGLSDSVATIAKQLTAFADARFLGATP